MTADFAMERSRADLERHLASAGPELAEVLRAALDAGEGTDAWEAAVFALGVNP